MTATIGKPYTKYKDYAESYHVAGTRPEDSFWRGKLAPELGYGGTINQFAYDLASEGKDSYGRQLRKYQKNSRPAICDVTLNAPKSVSVEALVNENPIALAAHDKGVESALQFTEQHLLFSQVKRQGQVERVHTERALIGSFRQRDNREGEPHLHTHNVVFNVGRVEGKWRSLANEQVYNNKLTIGAIYQNDTAYHLHQAGYRTYWDANGQFELAGNPKQLLESTFSKRTERLEAYLASQGLDRKSATAKQLDAANRATRNKKAYDKDVEEQVWDWKSQAATAGIRACQAISLQELEHLFQAAAHPGSPREIVIAAALRLTENASAFGYMELVREGCRLSSGRYLSTEIQKAIEQSRELIAVASNNPYPSYTTRTILQQERQILDWAIQNKSSYAAISDKDKATVAAEKFTLNSDQTKALQHIARSRDLVTLIQGSAGVGKTRSLSALKDLMGERPLIGCAVGGLQAEALEADSGIPSQTLSSLIRTKSEDFPQNALIVVDEAGVVSNRQMYRLIEQALESNCRLLLVGDTKQLSAVEQGNPFQLLQTRAGLLTACISQNMRQKDEQLKAVVDLCEAQEPAKAFDLLNSQGKISEIVVENQRTEAIVADFLNRPLEQRRNTLIMATTHKERATLTQAIRDRLINQGTLSGPALEIEVLQKKDLDKHQLLIADSYQVGDRVKFWRNSGAFTKGELYQVTATDSEAHAVELIDASGQTYTLDLYRYKDREVFSQEHLEIRAGEEMRFTAGLKDHNGRQVQVNGQKFRVEAIDPQTQTIEVSTKGKRLTLTPEDLLHSDYRWISTVHSLQGTTVQYAIFAAGQGSGALLSRESWYVAASRAQLEFTVYCGEKAQLRESIQSSRAQQPAIELIHPPTPTPIKALTPTPPPLRPELLAAQFRILTDQILAPEAVYQDNGLRIERSSKRLTVSIEGKEVDIKKPENLAPLVNHLQVLVNEFQLLSVYSEFQEAARLETSIKSKAAELVKLNQGDYLGQGISVELTGSQIEIQHGLELVFKSNQGHVQRPDDLSKLENLERQMTGTIRDLKQMLEAQRLEEARKAEEARLEASGLNAQREEATRNTTEIQRKERGHGLAR